MKCTLLALLMWSCATFANAEKEPNCGDPSTQIDMNICAGRDFKKADKELNEEYLAVLALAAGRPSLTSNLRKAQRAWIKFRDAEVDANFSCDEAEVSMCFGSSYSMDRSLLMARLTRARVDQLVQQREWLKGH